MYEPAGLVVRPAGFDLCGLGLDLQTAGMEKVLISLCSSENRTKSAHVSFRGLLQFAHVGRFLCFS